MPGTGNRHAGNGSDDGLTTMFESTTVKVVQEEEKPFEDEGVRVKLVRKPGTNTVPQVQPEPAITPSHYDAAVKKKGSTARTPVRGATTPMPGAPPESSKEKCEWCTVVLGMFD